MWVTKNPIKQTMPSQMYSDLRTREAIGRRSIILAEVTDPTPFMPFPRNTFPRGPKMMLIRIKGIVFSWSLRVCVTWFPCGAVQNSKNGRISVALRLENSRAIPARGTATLRKVMNLRKASPCIARGTRPRCRKVCKKQRYSRNCPKFKIESDSEFGVQCRNTALPFCYSQSMQTGRTRIQNEMPCPQAC